MVTFASKLPSDDQGIRRGMTAEIGPGTDFPVLIKISQKLPFRLRPNIGLRSPVTTC